MNDTTTQGKDIKQLLDVLKVLDRDTKVKKINSEAEKLKIDCQLKNGKIVDWEINLQGMNVQAPPYTKGKTFGELKTALDSRDVEKEMFRIEQSCDVLCYLDTSTHKHKGKTVTRFYRLEPGYSYMLDTNGQPHFRIVSFELTDWEFERIMETRLAFYMDGVIYPIAKQAAISVGSILDCSAAFKHMEERPLGAALLLSEKLESSRGVKVVYRQCTALVKPIIAISKQKYVHVPQYEFFEKTYAMTAELSHIGFFDVRLWKVSDQQTTLDLMLTSDPRYGIEITTGDYSGIAMTINAYYIVGKCRIPIKKNSESHTQFFLTDGYNRLFEGIGEALEEFMGRVHKNAVFRKKEVKPIFDVIGKIRTRNVDIPLIDGEVYDSDFMLETVVNHTYAELSAKQNRDLCEAYKKFYHKIREEVV